MAANINESVQVVPTTGDAQLLLVKIQRAHLIYLNLDEGTAKLRARRDLEMLIANHLCSVPHKEKFTCSNFGQLLRHTIDDRPDFKASGAAQAFDALERYALNIIMQPWRQEFFCVRLYSGFFKNNVACYLSNVEEIFYLMGYEPADGMELRLGEQIDLDRVTVIALNCLMAAVECQLMMEILEKVGGTYSWKEISRIRRHCVDFPENTAEILLQNSNRINKVPGKTTSDFGQYLSSRSSGHGSNGYIKVEQLVDVPVSCSWTEDLSDSMMNTADERGYKMPCSYWDQKTITFNGQLFNRRPQPISSFFADHEKALCLMKDDYRRRSLQCDDDGLPTVGVDSSGFVEQSSGYNNKDCNVGREDTLKNSYKKKQMSNEYTRLSYATQNRPSQVKGSTHAVTSYGRLPGFQKKPISMDISMEHVQNIPPITEIDLIQLGNPQSNLGFHPAIFKSDVVNDDVSYSTQQHYHHPVYEAILNPTSTPRQMANMPILTTNFYGSLNRQGNHLDLLLTAVPPPPPPPLPFLETIEGMGNLQLVDDYVIPMVTRSSDVATIGGTRDRERKSKKVTQSAKENRRSTYDNLCQDVVDTGDTTTTTIDTAMVVSSSPSPPLTSIAVANMERRTKTKDLQSSKPSGGTSSLRRNKKSSTNEVDLSSTTTTTTTRDKSRTTAATSTSTPVAQRTHERSASVGSTRSTTSSSSTSINVGGRANSNSTGSQSKWECWACTYLNDATVEVCEICSRSRFKGDESSPLFSGGHECQNCTLINVKGSRKCSACNCNLENSPTYV